MSFRIIIAVVGMLTLASILCAAGIYVWQFGGHLSTMQDTWAQFGDYFGGVLNPIFAMFAFLGLLWSIISQAKEFRSSAELLQRQTKSAEEQLTMLRVDRLRDDLLHVIKEIDARVEQILEIDISMQGSPTASTIRQMQSEAQRLRRLGGDSPAYRAFLLVAKTPGAVVEAPIRELTYLIERMREFLKNYSETQGADLSLTLIYYADKSSRLMDMLEDVGGLSDGTRAFFATMCSTAGASRLSA